jgi:hypothetical protein
MASVSVKVKISEEKLKEVAFNTSEVRSAITKGANQIAGRANGSATEKSGIWHEIGVPHTPGKEGGVWKGTSKEIQYTIGGQQAEYQAKPAKPTRDGTPVAIVVTANYAAQKDNMKHNTLVRAIG